MNPTSIAEISHAPQRRNRGTRIIAAPQVSPMASRIVNGKLTEYGTLNCSILVVHPSGSVIFQMPDTRNSSAISAAAPCEA